LHPGSIPGEASTPYRFRAPFCNVQTRGTTLSMVEIASARRNMVDTQLRTYDVTSKRLLDAVEAVDRACFLPADRQSLAYLDQAVVLTASDGTSRSLLPPMIFARMLQAADLETAEKVLDVAGGSGYSAAVMAAMGAEVVALEATESVSALARTALQKASITSIECHSGDLLAGYAAAAPYDVIFINGSIMVQPKSLIAQLRDGGRLVAVEGFGRAGRVVVYRKSGEVTGKRGIFDAAAAPLGAFMENPAFSF
jgi:protein-L-isoaspartate(D-aspartate) O-methyltransferase